MTEVFKPRANMTHDKYNRWKCLDGKGCYICDGGPSQIWDDGRGWYFYDSIRGYHRLDGPAWSLGLWYINNKNITLEIEKFAEENGIDLENLSDEDKVLIALAFG